MKTTDQDKCKMLELYNSGYTNKEISNELNIPIHRIYKILKTRGCSFESRQKYYYNTDVFKNITNEHQAYWLGFIWGDGSVSIKNPSLRIEINQRDINHLKKFQLFMNTNSPIKLTNKQCCIIGIYNKHIVDNLSLYNIIPNKTYIYNGLPNICNNLMSHFYRGVLDADGWITIHKSKTTKFQQCDIGFSSYHESFLKEIKNWFINNLLLKSGYIVKRKRKNQQVYQYIIGGRNNFVKIYDLLYKNSTIYLDRKYEKITKIYQNIINQQQLLN